MTKVSQHLATKTGITVLIYGLSSFDELSIKPRSIGHQASCIETYLGERDSAILVLVHFLDDFSRLFLADVEAAGHDQSFEFFARDAATVVLI